MALRPWYSNVSTPQAHHYWCLPWDARRGVIIINHLYILPSFVYYIRLVCVCVCVFIVSACLHVVFCTCGGPVAYIMLNTTSGYTVINGDKPIISTCTRHVHYRGDVSLSYAVKLPLLRMTRISVKQRAYLFHSIP